MGHRVQTIITQALYKASDKFTTSTPQQTITPHGPNITKIETIKPFFLHNIQPYCLLTIQLIANQNIYFSRFRTNSNHPLNTRFIFFKTYNTNKSKKKNKNN